MTENKTRTMEVVVHKAAVPLLKGESLHKFTSVLSQKGAEHCFKKLNLIKGKDGAFMVEAFGDAAVFGCYKGADPMTYHVFKYDRDATSGAFDFGDLTEVEKVVGYRPKTMGMSKKGLMPGVVPSPKPSKKPAKKPDSTDPADLVVSSKPKKVKKGFWGDIV